MSRRKTYEERKVEQKKRRLIVIGILILIAVIISAFALYNHTHGVTTERGFKSYAAKEVKKIRVFKGDFSSYDCKCTVDDSRGVAVFTDDSKYDYVSDYIDTYVSDLEYKLTEKQDKDSFRGLIVNASTCESNKKTVSLILTYESSTLKSGDLQVDYRGKQSYLFSKEDKKTIAWQQLFNDDYETNVSKYFGDKISDFSTFAVNKAGVTYLTLEKDKTTKKNDIKAVEVPIETSGKWMRDKIATRWVDPNKPMIALTYDDGPGDRSEDKIHDVLEKYNAVATFFYTGSRVKGREDKLKRSLANGCEIGSHTWNHPVLTHCSKKKLKKQLDGTNEAIKKACGQNPTVFRPSYGATNKKINNMSNLPVIIWDIDTLDWKTKNAKKIYKAVIKKKKLDGKIVLMHCIYGFTADATAKIVPWLDEHGYQMVTVSELIKYKYKENPKAAKVYSGWY